MTSAKGSSAVVSSTYPPQLIADADGHVPHETIMAMNDHLAGLVARHPGRIHGLASVDAYDGDRAAARPSAPSATLACGLVRRLRARRPVDRCAAGASHARGRRKARRAGVRPSRGAAAADETDGSLRADRDSVRARHGEFSGFLIALVEGGVFSQLPGLRVVVTAHAIGGLAMAAGLSEPEPPALRHHRRDAQACLHRHDAHSPRVDPRVGRSAGRRPCDGRQRLADCR